MSLIHESVIIEDGAKIASDVTIGPFCHIGKDVELASGCKLESNILLNGKLSVGKDVRIFSFTTIGYNDTEITIGEKSHIREFVKIGSKEDESKPYKKITVGKSNFIMGYAQLFSGVHLGSACIITNAVKLYDNVRCEDRVIIGGLSTVEANNTIGSGVMIGGASYVNHDLPPFTLVEGNRASIKGLNVIGLRRRLENKDDIEDIKVIFKRILGDSIDKELALELSTSHENEYVKMFASFVAKSNMK